MVLFQMTIDDEVLRMSTDEIVSRARLLENDIKVSLSLFCDRAVIIVSEIGL